MKTTKILAILVMAFGLVVCSGQPAEATPMGTGFTYQGHLYDNNDVADGSYDFAFKLYDANTGGSQQAGTIDVNDIDVIDGHFTVQLDFGGGVFDGNAIWLETTVAQSGGSDPCTLSPRLELTPTPYALHTRGILVDNDNTFLGLDAGYYNTEGPNNTFVGTHAGYRNTTGFRNTAAGSGSFYNNTTGAGNSAMGYYALGGNTTGNYNTAIGKIALGGNTTGNYNTAVGFAAGFSCAGSNNVFLGCKAGYNESGSNKLYIANGPADSNVLIYGKFDTGQVGIGTTSPNYKLDVEGNIFVNGTEGFDAAGEDAIVHFGHPGHSIRGEHGTGVLISAYAADDALTVREVSGNVGIGTTDPNGKLDVNGSIYQRGGVLHADYVFESDYQLESIDEHSKLMWQNKHLPAIPEARVDENGRQIVEVGSHRRGIVEELEKAHIYIEQLHNRIKVLEERLIQSQEEGGQ